MKKILFIIICTIIFIYGCSSVIEPEKKPSYTIIVYHGGKLIDNIVIYYIDYSDGAEWSDYKPTARISRKPWDDQHHDSAKWIIAGEKFEWQEKWWHCKIINISYIELK